MSVAVLILQVLACTGLGAALFRVLKLDAFANRQSRIVWCFVIGMGALGWLLFWLGAADMVRPGSIGALLLASAAGNVFLFKCHPEDGSGWRDSAPLDAIGWTLIALLAAVFCLDFIEALAPPADADTLAYHYALAKTYLREGGLVFVPRAVDGAVPLLFHMTYVSALGLGGEQALTLWSLLTGYAAPALLFVAARDYLDSRWSLALALLFATTPAVVYGGGSGQVEVRNAAFVIAGALALCRARGEREIAWLAVAGIAAGFFAASKAFGLLFVAAAGVTAICHRRWFRRGLVFSLAALAAGSQWYVFNAYHSGDPVFPTLYGLLGTSDPAFWNPAHDAVFKERMASLERALPRTPWHMVLFPFAATFSGNPVFEGGRVGFGPLAMVFALPALLALWRHRAAVRRHPLLPMAAAAALFYALWFLIGPSQRLRHLLPLYPLVLLLLAVAAHRWAADGRRWRTVAVLAAAPLLLQLAVQGLFQQAYVTRLVNNEPREAFLMRTVSKFEPVPWINAHLGGSDVLLSAERQLEYYLKPRMFFADPDDARIDVLPETDDPARFLRQMQAQGVTHVLGLDSGNAGSGGANRGFYMWRTLRDAGCLTEIKSFETQPFGSRTLGPASDARITAHLMRLTPDRCRLD